MDIDHIATEPDRSPKRIRHELRFRRLDVTEVLTLSPSMVRVIFSGDDLKDFVSLGFDDHVKFFVPAEGEGMPVVPSLGPDGLVFPEGAPKPIGRDYTPRHFDPVRKTLAIDFALHDEGPATQWARRASAGMQVAIGGPRGSFIIPLAFDWHLLIADETGLPALARRLEELPTNSKAIAIVEVEGLQHELAISSRADISLHWVHRKDLPAGSVEPLISAVADIPFPAGDFHTWIACESAVAKALRTWLIGNRNGNPKWMRASGYWRRGNAGVHDHHDS